MGTRSPNARVRRLFPPPAGRRAAPTASRGGPARRRAAGTRPPAASPARRTRARDVRRLARLCRPESQVLQPVEELEPHAAPPQHLVERREHDVAHPGSHLPEESAAVGEEGADRAAQRLPRGDPRPSDVAVLVGEGEIVERAHERARDRALRGAVQQQPLAAIVVVDGVEPARVGQQPEPDRRHAARPARGRRSPTAPRLDRRDRSRPRSAGARRPRSRPRGGSSAVSAPSGEGRQAPPPAVAALRSTRPTWRAHRSA